MLHLRIMCVSFFLRRFATHISFRVQARCLNLARAAAKVKQLRKTADAADSTPFSVLVQVETLRGSDGAMSSACMFHFLIDPRKWMSSKHR
jgi:hypothetical protein